MHLAQIITEQLRSVLVMAAAGVLTESIWQLKRKVQSVLCKDPAGGVMTHTGRCIAAIISAEIAFWACAFTILSLFLYYSSFGLVTFHGIVSFLAGVLLWKKICCGIIDAWVKTDAAQNSVTAAVSSTWKKRGKKDTKKGRLKEKKKKKKQSVPQKRKAEERQLSEENATEGV